MKKRLENIVFVVLCIVLVGILGYCFFTMEPGPPKPYEPPKVEKQKVIRGEILYKGETITVILREDMEPK